MDAQTSSSIALRCSTRAGALEVLREIERLLLRVPAALPAEIADWSNRFASVVHRFASAPSTRRSSTS